MNTIGSITLMLAAFLAVVPAMADEGAGGPVPGFGPGGAGATSDDTVVVGAGTRGQAIALYNRHPLKAQQTGAPPIR